MSCELCDTNGGTPLWRDERCRVVLIDEPGYPGFCRVIWNSHVKEMTDLGEADCAHLMRMVFGVEKALRELLQPDKVNLASLGNAVPHLHWHVIPRYRDDAHFPNPIWGSSLRPPRPASTTDISTALANRMVRLQTEIGKM
ncbi:MAG TPA: HIT family protein [Burkholderiales bacterium]|nr:HIT family protein [Burkholderiales bacterium]